MAASYNGNEAIVDYCLDHHCNVDQQDTVSKIASYDPWYISHWTPTNTNIDRVGGQPCMVQLLMAD